MAKTVQERSAKAAEKRLTVAEKELRHKVRPGIEKAMERIRPHGEVRIFSEVLQIAIMKRDSMGDKELIEFLRYPRHKILISENVAQDFYRISLNELHEDTGTKLSLLRRCRNVCRAVTSTSRLVATSSRRRVRFF